MSGHGRWDCTECGKTYQRCRCPWNDATHTVRHGICPDCRHAERLTQRNADIHRILDEFEELLRMMDQADPPYSLGARSDIIGMLIKARTELPREIPTKG